ncbi:6424_t:CDS:1, partial [Ambispora leptoticha]
EDAMIIIEDDNYNNSTDNFKRFRNMHRHFNSSMNQFNEEHDAMRRNQEFNNNEANNNNNNDKHHFFVSYYGIVEPI